MPLPPVTVPLYPNVPIAPGVPVMLRSVLSPPTPAPTFISADGAGVGSSQQFPQWGLYDANGNMVVVPDSIVAFEFVNDYRVSDYPLEQGAFESYNKVANPFDIRLVMTCGGQNSSPEAFLDSIDATIKSLSLFNVVTPEKTYLNVNAVHNDYQRQSYRGARLLTVEMWVREIRLTATSQYASTQAPSGASAVSSGTVQPQTLTTQQAASTTTVH